jgi:hypothetical protein
LDIDVVDAIDADTGALASFSFIFHELGNAAGAAVNRGEVLALCFGDDDDVVGVA